MCCRCASPVQLMTLQVWLHKPCVCCMSGSGAAELAGRSLLGSAMDGSYRKSASRTHYMLMQHADMSWWLYNVAKMPSQPLMGRIRNERQHTDSTVTADKSPDNQHAPLAMQTTGRANETHTSPVKQAVLHATRHKKHQILWSMPAVCPSACCP